MTLDPFSSRVINNTSGLSVDLPTDKILFFTIGSNSSSAAGNVESIVNSFTVQMASGLYPFIFTNDSVSGDFYKNKLAALYNYFFQKNILGADNAFVPV
jgi:hypothetical protein